MSAPGIVLTPAQLLERLPQQPPFRFVDEIVSVDDERIQARYRWRPEADFYRGHFPGDPVTPGVLLVESLAQSSVVALGIYLLAKELPEEEAAKIVPFFTDATVEFSGIVRPGARVRLESRKLFWRRRKLRIEGQILLEDGTVVCSGTLAGLGVVR
jgi:3-hydroxyacyl-[acyl-carrier-protein] dehydratase